MTGVCPHAHINAAIVTEVLHLPDETQELIGDKLHQSAQHALYNVGRHCIYLLEKESPQCVRGGQ